jgi:hypothetical protein
VADLLVASCDRSRQGGVDGRGRAKICFDRGGQRVSLYAVTFPLRYVFNPKKLAQIVADLLKKVMKILGPAYTRRAIT